MKKKNIDKKYSYIVIALILFVITLIYFFYILGFVSNINIITNNPFIVPNINNEQLKKLILHFFENEEFLLDLLGALISLPCLCYIYLYDIDYTESNLDTTFMMAKGGEGFSTDNSSENNSSGIGADNSSSTKTSTIEKEKDKKQQIESETQQVEDTTKENTGLASQEKNKEKSEIEALSLDKGKGKAKLDSLDTEDPLLKVTQSKGKSKQPGLDDYDSEEYDYKKEQIKADYELAKKLEQED